MLFMNGYKICKNRIHIFPFPEECPKTEHADCDESFSNALGDQGNVLEIRKTFPPCKFCFPKNRF